MLYFFDDKALRRHLNAAGIIPPTKPLDPKMESLPEYEKVLEEYIVPVVKRLYAKIVQEPLSLEEMDAYSLLSRVEKSLKHLLSTLDFADRAGKRDDLENRLRYLHTYGGEKTTRCVMYHDFAPYSFSFVMENEDPETGEWKTWFNGGLIYHGAHDLGGDGGAPTFSVNLSPHDGWSVHT